MILILYIEYLSSVGIRYTTPSKIPGYLASISLILDSGINPLPSSTNSYNLVSCIGAYTSKCLIPSLGLAELLNTICGCLLNPTLDALANL